MECADTGHGNKIRIYECIMVQKLMSDELENFPCISLFEIM